MSDRKNSDDIDPNVIVKVALIVAACWLLSNLFGNAAQIPVLIWTSLFEMLGRVAWPAAAILGAYWFRADIVLLAQRLKKAGPVELAVPQRFESSATESLVEAHQNVEALSPTVGGSSVDNDTINNATVVPPPANPQIEMSGVAPAVSEDSTVSYFAGPPAVGEDATLDRALKVVHEVSAPLATESRANSERKLAITLAHALVRFDFNEISLMIFGSQFYLLQVLSNRPTPSHRNMWRRFWRRRNAPEGETPETWISWLVARELVSLNENDAVSITQKGKDFLVFAKTLDRDLMKNPG